MSETENTMQFPITVTGIEFEGDCYRPENLLRGKCGDFVSVRIASGSETHLGILLGEIGARQNASLSKSGTLTFYTMPNPAIFVPDLNRVVFGYESWWGLIKSPDELRQITDADIENVWYVQALKALESPEQAAETQP